MTQWWQQTLETFRQSKIRSSLIYDIEVSSPSLPSTSPMTTNNTSNRCKEKRWKVTHVMLCYMVIYLFSASHMRLFRGAQEEECHSRVQDPQPMFPLSCAHVRTHTSRETSAHKKTWSTHKRSLQKCFLHIFHTRRSKYRWVPVKCCTNEILYAHRL